MNRHNKHMDNAVAREQDASWGTKTDLNGLFKIMGEERTSKQKQNIRSVIVEVTSQQDGPTGLFSDKK